MQVSARRLLRYSVDRRARSFAFLFSLLLLPVASYNSSRPLGFTAFGRFFCFLCAWVPTNCSRN